MSYRWHYIWSPNLAEQYTARPETPPGGIYENYHYHADHQTTLADERNLDDNVKTYSICFLYKRPGVKVHTANYIYFLLIIVVSCFPRQFKGHFLTGLRETGIKGPFLVGLVLGGSQDPSVRVWNTISTVYRIK